MNTAVLSSRRSSCDKKNDTKHCAKTENDGSLFREISRCRAVISFGLIIRRQAGFRQLVFYAVTVPY